MFRCPDPTEASPGLSPHEGRPKYAQSSAQENLRFSRLGTSSGMISGTIRVLSVMTLTCCQIDSLFVQLSGSSWVAMSLLAPGSPTTSGTAREANLRPHDYLTVGEHFTVGEHRSDRSRMLQRIIECSTFAVQSSPQMQSRSLFLSYFTVNLGPTWGHWGTSQAPFVIGCFEIGSKLSGLRVGRPLRL